jgi:hypothetical protein
MTSEIRYAAGTRVRFERDGHKPFTGILTEDCKMWHSFATVRDRSGREYSVWAGDIQPI